MRDEWESKPLPRHDKARRTQCRVPPIPGLWGPGMEAKSEKAPCPVLRAAVCAKGGKPWNSMCFVNTVGENVLKWESPFNPAPPPRRLRAHSCCIPCFLPICQVGRESLLAFEGDSWQRRTHSMHTTPGSWPSFPMSHGLTAHSSPAPSRRPNLHPYLPAERSPLCPSSSPRSTPGATCAHAQLPF